MRILAMYLPQFHKVKENDEWWGEGFTEWVAVKSAEMLFKGHKQPHIPYNENYYDLLQRETMEWQAGLLSKYGIDGLVFYHYYFKDGRKILEKPAENLLNWKEINIPFCFSWANESWVRSWSNIPEGNPWSQRFDLTMNKKNGSGVLLEQAYGNDKEWEEHFYYLLPFFKDNRYIKIEGKPVFLFHKDDSIHCLADMLSCWNMLAVKNGLPGIYTIGTNIENKNGLDAIMYREPAHTMENYFNTVFADDDVREKLDYDEVWKYLIAKDIVKGNVCLGGFVGYDDTPRRGRNGKVIIGTSPDKFKRYMSLLLKKADECNSEFVFVNAWNEWGEGMYLEPNQEYGYAFLEAFAYAKTHYKDETEEMDELSLLQMKYDIALRENKNLKKRVDWYRSYWKNLDIWMSARETSISISDKLIQLGVKKIAIYGMGMLAKHLVWELQQNGKKELYICYGIDQGGRQLTYDFPIYSLSDYLEKVDAIIVTVTYDYEKIKKQLEKVTDCQIISLERLLVD